jgi:hypothetical protein
LKTLHEEKQNPELDEAKKLIAEAKRVFFLGFGYAPENMNILGLSEIIALDSSIYGTGLGLEQKEIGKIESGIWSGLKPDPILGSKRSSYSVEIKDMDCLKLLENYL